MPATRNETMPAPLLHAAPRHAILDRLAVRRAALLLSVLYVVALALIAFWPTPVDRAGHDALQRGLAWLQEHGAPGWLTYGMVEFASNIVLFIPAGLLVVVLAGARFWWLGPLGGLLGSAAIELGQLVLLPARTASPRDIVANTSGAVIGSILALLVFGVLALRSRRRVRRATASANARPARAR
ncbi:VanZ family protein [Cryobacterium frigoriphilum]|uniref:VanZ family protein n=1 Tax=Cryobacterium frigoriphilum TaxID=1259150 RepID=A0A4R8ZU14_9MICO|nr:VanZ family protein [Cryobacterium frigoriphilum]TFD45845.1 VanZ family protein [Cryobacterium frigoriphilum]